MTPCRYHEQYGGGRSRIPQMTCKHHPRWMLTIRHSDAFDTALQIPICALHRRAVDARWPEFKNDEGRWESLEPGP